MATTRQILLDDIQWLASSFSNRLFVLDYIKAHEIFELHYKLNKHPPLLKELDFETDKNTECPILYEEIKENDIYMQCSECKYNFSEKSLIKCLRKKSICPMCRTEWNNFCKYKNYSLKKILENIMVIILMISNKQNTRSYTKRNAFTVFKPTKFNKKWFYGK